MTQQWKTVPVEPTPEMLKAADRIIDCDPIWIARAYRAMLSAAPEAPQPAKRVPLTDEAIAALWLDSISGPLTATKFASAVIAAYEAKNGIAGADT